MIVDKVTQVGYAVVIEGNGGEEQLTLIATSGQNGKTKFIAVATQVDFGQTILKDEVIHTDDLPYVVKKVFHDWHKPNAIGGDSEINNDLAKVLACYEWAR